MPSDPGLLSIPFSGPEQALVAFTYLQTTRQAHMLAFEMIFALFGGVMAVGIPATLLMRRR